MITRGFSRSLLSVTAAITLGAFPFAAQAEEYDLPRLLVVGTPGTASGSFASTNGWAPVLQDQTNVVARIVPEDSERQRYTRLTERRDIRMSSVPAAELRSQVEGIGAYAGSKPVAQHMVWHHNDTPWGFIVSGESDIQTMSDLNEEGVKVALPVFSPTLVATMEKALPAYLGLSPEEAAEKFEYVPTSSYVETCRSVVEGKADVTYCAAVSSVLSEMEGAPGGIRWLEMDGDKDAWNGYLTHRPMLIPADISIGVSSAKGVAGVTSNFIYAVPADDSEDFAYNMAKWFHKSFDDYKDVHPLAARMELGIFLDYIDRSPVPVHAGTVRYLEEIDAWSEERERRNQEAIALMNQWIEARQAALEEARENRIRPDQNDEAFMEIYNKHTEGLDNLRSRL